ncbi:ABC transporter permease [Candidatus Sumerlaeota bacterium]|nr:ABC transporter permease [Candidatus Sumerlaeota bacterium]
MISPSTDSQYITSFGAWLMKMVHSTGDFVMFSGDSLRRVVWGRPRFTHITHQMVTIGIESLPIANLTAFFVGMVMVLNTGYQLALFGVKNWAAGITAIALAREMVPVFTAVVVGAKVAASIAAELGTMRVTEQIDAMEVAGVNPVSQLVVPRVVATLVMLPVITIYSLIIGFIGGMIVGNFALHIPPRQFYEGMISWLMLSDVYTGIAKTFVFAVIIALVGCHNGFRAEGGAAGVGRATTGAVVVSLTAILVSNYILATWFLFLLNQL